MRITVELTDELAEVTAVALERYAHELHQRLVRIVRDRRGNEEFHFISRREGEARVASRTVREAIGAYPAGATEGELRILAGNR
ncbi:MAG TPA: hypothetical protein VM285_07800 [Polyangia bacterium]|nr:hypothetical protein [Polyangia bacterium]